MQQKTARLNMRVEPKIREKLEEEARKLGLSLTAVARIKLSIDLSNYLQEMTYPQTPCVQGSIGGGSG